MFNLIKTLIFLFFLLFATHSWGKSKEYYQATLIHVLTECNSECRSDVFEAEINKAFKIYEHGISSEKTAELLGVSLWDLSSYIGQSSISEAHISMSMPVKKRLKIAEDIFQ